MPHIKKTINCLFVRIFFIGSILISTVSTASNAIPDLEANRNERSLSNPSYVLGQYLFRKYNGSNALLDFPPAYEYLRDTVSRLVSHTDLHNKTVELALLNSSQANAFVIPGNHLFIYTDILSLIQNEDELFALLAHELSHLELRHYERRVQNAEQEKKRLLAVLAAGLAAAILASDTETTSALWIGGIANQASNQLAYSRENEQEADRRGRLLLNEAGISSNAMTKLFSQFLKKALGGSKLEFLSTHPLPQTRFSDSITGQNTTPPTPNKNKNFLYFRATLLAYRALLEESPITYIKSLNLGKDETLFAIAIAQYQSTTPEESIKTLRSIQTNNRFTDYLLAVALMKNQENKEAEKIIKERLELAPEDQIFLPLLAQIEKSNYIDYDLDESQFELRLKLKSNIQIAIARGDSSLALMYKSLLEFNRGKYQVAQILLKRASSLGLDSTHFSEISDYYRRIEDAEKSAEVGL